MTCNRNRLRKNEVNATYFQGPAEAFSNLGLNRIFLLPVAACRARGIQGGPGSWDRGGKDDKSFNSSAYEGAMEAKKKLGVYVKYVEATDDNAFEPLLRAFAQRDFDLIIGIGFAQKEALKKVAAQFPKKHFAIIDANVEAPNIESLIFEEHEGAYLIGAIAALTSKTGTIGFVGGMDIPLIRRFAMGYEAGAKKINPQIKVRR